MLENPKLKVELAPPEAGWTRVMLSAGDSHYQFLPSHVPYDSISELVSAMLKILDGYPEATVRWNDEPVEHEFVFACEGARINFTVYEIINSVVAGRVRERRFAFGGVRYDVLCPFLMGLREIRSRQGLEEYERQWREPFPEREMLELTQRIKSLKLDGASNRKV